MNLSDLGFIFTLLVFAAGLLGLLAALLMRSMRSRTLAKRIALGLAAYAGLYVILLVGVSLLSPQRVLALNEARCFDDWCAAVIQVERRPAIGDLKPNGSFYLVTLRVSSRAQRIRQRALDAAVTVVDERGMRYDPSVEGQRALESTAEAGPPLNSWLEPGASFEHTAVFDLPADAVDPGLVIRHGAFPGLLIIGDDQSFLHKPAIVRLSSP